MEQDLWREFRTGNPFENQVDGVMYAVRYTPERIEAHRGQVITALKTRDVEFFDLGSLVGVNYTGPDSGSVSVIALLEELSALNEAADYKMHGLNSIADLSGVYAESLYNFLFKPRQHDPRMPEAYDLTLEMFNLATALKSRDKTNRMLYAHERRILDALIDTTKKKEKMLNSPGKIALFPVGFP